MKIFINRKGDLSLSVNAIVVLVIAIIFLGLAIGFTTKLIGSSKDKLLSGVENVDISSPATSENEMIFDGKLEVKVGGSQPIKISFYNNGAADLAGAKPALGSCISDGTGSLNPDMNFVALATPIERFKEQRYQAILKAGTTSTGTYLCIVNMTAGSFKKQVAITVIS